MGPAAPWRPKLLGSSRSAACRADHDPASPASGAPEARGTHTTACRRRDARPPSCHVLAVPHRAVSRSLLRGTCRSLVRGLPHLSCATSRDRPAVALCYLVSDRSNRPICHQRAASPCIHPSRESPGAWLELSYSSFLTPAPPPTHTPPLTLISHASLGGMYQTNISRSQAVCR